VQIIYFHAPLPNTSIATYLLPTTRETSDKTTSPQCRYSPQHLSYQQVEAHWKIIGVVSKLQRCSLLEQHFWNHHPRLPSLKEQHFHHPRLPSLKEQHFHHPRLPSLKEQHFHHPRLPSLKERLTKAGCDDALHANLRSAFTDLEIVGRPIQTKAGCDDALHANLRSALTDLEIVGRPIQIQDLFKPKT
jgi:hypothetical protein